MNATQDDITSTSGRTEVAPARVTAKQETLAPGEPIVTKTVGPLTVQDPVLTAPRVHVSYVQTHAPQAGPPARPGGVAACGGGPGSGLKGVDLAECGGQTMAATWGCPEVTGGGNVATAGPWQSSIRCSFIAESNAPRFHGAVRLRSRRRGIRGDLRPAPHALA